MDTKYNWLIDSTVARITLNTAVFASRIALALGRWS